MSQATLGTLVTYNPRAVAACATLESLLQMLSEPAAGYWPVVDEERRLQGMVCESAIVAALQARNLTSAAEIMTADVVTIARDGTPKEALKLLVSHGLHSLPVLEDGRLIGLITSGDFLRELSYGELPSARETVSDHLQKPTEPVEPTDTFADALHSMDAAQTQFIAVAKDGFPLGVIARREILQAQCRLALQQMSETISKAPTTLIELVHRSPTLRPVQKLSEAAALLIERQLSAAPVVNQANRLMGIISEDDILRAILAQMN